MRALHIGGGPLHVVSVGAHPDDVEIGCGGTLLKLASRESVTFTTVVMSGSAARAEEAREAAERFTPGASLHQFELRDGHLPAQWGEVKDALEGVASRVPAPDLVLAPRVDDAHQDHRLLGGLVRTVWRDAMTLHYEIPKWDGDMSAPTFFVPLSFDQARSKVEAIDASFVSQRSRDWWDEEMFFGLMRLRGVECRARYAEAFWVPKAVLSL